MDSEIYIEEINILHVRGQFGQLWRIKFKIRARTKCSCSCIDKIKNAWETELIFSLVLILIRKFNATLLM